MFCPAHGYMIKNQIVCKSGPEIRSWGIFGCLRANLSVLVEARRDEPILNFFAPVPQLRDFRTGLTKLEHLTHNMRAK